MEYKTNKLCLGCKNAANGCSWAREFKPVEGWTAEPTKIFCSPDIIDSYHITACPKFKPDEKQTAKDLTDSGCMALIDAHYRASADELRKRYTELIKAVVNDYPQHTIDELRQAVKFTEDALPESTVQKIERRIRDDFYKI